MASHDFPDPALLQRFDIRAPERVASRRRTDIWRVQRTDGSPAALKLYRGGYFGSEKAGCNYLSGQANGAIQLYDQTTGAVLLEWLDGPSLRDLARGGRDDEAAQHLASVAKRLHIAPPRRKRLFTPLAQRMTSLLDAEISADCPASTRALATRAQSLCVELLETPRPTAALHGDLHYENVAQGARGWLAMDPQGLWGDRTFDLATAFGTPMSARIAVTDPARIDRVSRLWAEGLGVDRHRLLQWGAVKVAHSLAFRGQGRFDAETDVALLARMIAAADRAQASRFYRFARRMVNRVVPARHDRNTPASTRKGRCLSAPPHKRHS